MNNSLCYYTVLARHWVWMIVLRIVICGGATYTITKMTRPDTQLIEIDVEESDPQLANEVSRGFAAFANAQLPGSVQVLPAQRPHEPIRPKVLQDTGIGALVRLTLIVSVEWIDERLAKPEEVRELLLWHWGPSLTKAAGQSASKGYKACWSL